MSAIWDIEPYTWPDIVLNFLVVGEKNVRLTPEHIRQYGVYLERSAMGWVRRIVPGENSATEHSTPVMEILKRGMVEPISIWW
jgi:hypothetical protein